MSIPTLSIVIVNWNTASLLRECVASIPVALRPDSFVLEGVIVVDNASHDDSLEGLDAPGVGIEVIRNDSNRGFAAACNQGAEKTDSDFLLFLNPDTRLFENSLIRPLQHMLAPESSNIGITGIQLLDESGHVVRTCARFPRLRQYAAMTFGIDRVFPSLGHFMREWAHEDTRDVDQIMGAFFLTRGHLFRSLGGFDERFFVYLEEVDFSLRARQLGWRSVYLSTAGAYHMGGGSSRKVKARRLFYALRSRLRYADKHFSTPARAGMWLLILAIEPIPRVAQLLLKGRFGELRDVFEGYRLLLSDLLSSRGPER